MKKKEKIIFYNLIFESDVVEFLNYDDMDIFTDNVKNIKVIGRGVDFSTIFEFSNQSGETMTVAFKDNNFYKYVNKINPIQIELDLDDCNKKITEFEIKILEKENELMQLSEEKDIRIDNDTMELMVEYKDKIKNYYDDILINSNNIDTEKDNMKTLMNAEILKI